MEETMPETEEKQQEQETEELSVEVEETPEETSSAEETQETQETEEVKAEESSGKEELEDYSEGVKKRINKLTAKLREAERREKAATDYAQSVQKELETTQQKTKTLDDSFVQEFENRLSFQEKALKNELKIAIDRDDSEKQTELQKQLADLAADQNKLKFVKEQKEQVKTENTAQTPQPEQQAPKPVDPKAQAWAEKNTWFGQDEPMTLTAFSIHKKLIEEEGYDPTSDEYYAELDNRIQKEFPHKLGSAEPKTNGRSTPPVGGATRGNQRAKQTKVKLTNSEVAIARKLGITNEQYARQKVRMQQP
jgi:hypothetical protein